MDRVRVDQRFDRQADAERAHTRRGRRRRSPARRRFRPGTGLCSGRRRGASPGSGCRTASRALRVATAVGDELHVEEDGPAVTGEAVHPLVGERPCPGLQGASAGSADWVSAAPYALGHVLVEDGEEEVCLALEVGVDGAVGVAGLLGDLLDGGAAVAAAGEDLARPRSARRGCGPVARRASPLPLRCHSIGITFE